MKLKTKALLVVTIICLAGAGIFQIDARSSGSLTSIYTDIAGKSCRTIFTHKETGATTQSCAGVAGYKLQVEDDDARMSITVVAPNGKKSELSYWSVITSGFSSLGQKAEWRVRKVKGKNVPVALIVRVNANEDSSNPEKLTSYLAVAKITAARTCVTEKIGPSATANEEARRAADQSADKQCLEDTRQE